MTIELFNNDNSPAFRGKTYEAAISVTAGVLVDKSLTSIGKIITSIGCHGQEA